MNMLPKMMEATRLTREGRLKEAMAVLRGALSPAAAPQRAVEDDGAMLDIVPAQEHHGADRPREELGEPTRALEAALGRAHSGRAAPLAVPASARFEERNYSNAGEAAVPISFTFQAAIKGRRCHW